MKVDSASLTNQNVAGLVEVGAAAIRAGDTAFDLSAVKEVDSAALALLLAWKREAAAAGKQISVDGCPAGLKSLAKLYGVQELLAIH